jgi:hypothetical protein
MTVPVEPPPLAFPTTADVAAILRARTKDLTGVEVGDFTADTRPTHDEVQRLIGQAYAEVTGQSGSYLHPRCAGAATALIVIRAAMWVKLSYFPEQVRSDRSVYQELADQYTAGMPGLLTCVEGNVPGAEGGDDGSVNLRFGMLDVHGQTSVRAPYGLPMYTGVDDAAY